VTSPALVPSNVVLSQATLATFVEASLNVTFTVVGNTSLSAVVPLSTVIGLIALTALTETS